MSEQVLTLKPKVFDFLNDIAIYDVLEAIRDQYNIPLEREGEFLDLTDAVMNGRLAVEKMPEFVKEAFGVSPENAKAISIQLVGHRLLPLDLYLGGAMEKQLIAWGGKVEDFPTLRIKEDPITVSSLLRGQADKLGLQLPEHLMKRFVYLAKGYKGEERTREATMTLMKRPLTIGGLGLKDKHVSKLLGWLDQVDLSTAVDARPPSLRATSVAKQSTGEEIASSPAQPVPLNDERREESALAKPLVELPVPAMTQALTKEVPVVLGELMEDHEKREIEAHKRTLKSMASAPQSVPLPETIEQAAGLLVENAPGKRLAKKKAVSLAEAVLKGRLETGRLYQQLKEVHGFDVKSAQAVMKPLVELKRVWEKSHIGAAFMPPVEDRGLLQDERTLLDRRHAALTKTTSKQSVEPVLLGARVSAARTKEEELTMQHTKVNVDAEREAKEKDRPLPVKVMLSRSSVPPKPASKEKPMMTDVKFTPTLIGPVEELGTMSIADFRRLSSDPIEAIRKIIDTLSLLEETDYEERIAGIAAWRKSPVNQLYLQMVSESLSTGHSVPEVASTRRNQGQESLSPAELQAIVTLNAQVKF